MAALPALRELLVDETEGRLSYALTNSGFSGEGLAPLYLSPREWEDTRVWEELTQRSDFGRPRLIDRFQIADPVSIDSLGETWAGYIAEGPECGRIVLVTTGNFIEKGRVAETLLQSAKRSSEIRHPNVLAFLAVHQEGPHISFVSEYLDGEPLSTLMRAASVQSAPLSQGVALRIVKEAIDALATLRQEHNSTMLPGALSPETVFVARFGEAMLRQPAVLAAAMRTRALSRHPAALPYRAPEHLDEPRFLSERADVYSAGVILWELLSGRPLFGDEDHLHSGRLKEFSESEAKEIERRCRTMEAPSLANISRPDGAIHPEVIQLVAHALMRDPEERPRSLRELSDALATLPSGTRANSAAVASAVDGLAGKVIARRNQVIAEAASIPVFGSEPPSNRVTFRPDKARVLVKLPRHPSLHGLAELIGPDAPPATSSNAPDSGQVLPHVLAAAGSSDIPMERHLPAFDISEKQRKRSGGRLIAVIVCLAAGTGTGYLVLEKSKQARDAPKPVVTAAERPSPSEETDDASDIEETGSAKATNEVGVDAAPTSDLRNHPGDPREERPAADSKPAESSDESPLEAEAPPRARSQPMKQTGNQEKGSAPGPFRPSGI